MPHMDTVENVIHRLNPDELGKKELKGLSHSRNKKDRLNLEDFDWILPHQNGCIVGKADSPTGRKNPY